MILLNILCIPFFPRSRGTSCNNSGRKLFSLTKIDDACGYFFYRMIFEIVIIGLASRVLPLTSSREVAGGSKRLGCSV